MPYIGIVIKQHLCVVKAASLVSVARCTRLLGDGHTRVGETLRQHLVTPGVLSSYNIQHHLSEEVKKIESTKTSSSS